MKNNKELLSKIRERNKNSVITPEIRYAQSISFAKGNAFDVFPEGNRLTREFVEATAKGVKTY
jgi:hypothetical protein